MTTNGAAAGGSRAAAIVFTVVGTLGVLIAGIATADPVRLRFDGVKPVPPLATTRPNAADRAEIDALLAELDSQLVALRKSLAGKPDAAAPLIADVAIYHKAVAFPLALDETVDPKVAKRTLAVGLDRAKQLATGNAPWMNVSGVRGYVSKIDGSVQPYILSIPAGYKPGDAKKWPIEYNSHGRSEDLTELRFLAGGTSTQPASGGAAAGTLGGDRYVVHLYGRYCNASKFAGEIDLLEVMQDVESRYPIDKARRLVMGFSMGGASTWHLAVHYPDLWAAASPGAGFAETKLYQKLTPQQIDAVPWYQQKLWHLYDATDYVLNLSNLPMIAYAGEIDPQKQSSDVMIAAAEKEGVTIDRIIGPKTAHAYEKGAKAELDKRLAALLEKGRDPNPTKIRLETWTLRYDQLDWLHITALERHWEPARVEGEQKAGGGQSTTVLKTQNVAAFWIQMSFKTSSPHTASFDIDGQRIYVEGSWPPPDWAGTFVKQDGKWKNDLLDYTLRKKHGLQGPIDDAFMDSFVIVKPSGTPRNAKAGAWAAAEMDHAIDQWRRMFRGDPQVIDDTTIDRELEKWHELYSEVTSMPTDAPGYNEKVDRWQKMTQSFAGSNLILFGDPSSNKLIGRIADKLPIKWTADAVVVGDRKFAADHHALVMVYPNPLNPKKYIVLNSGFTFREGDYLTNAQQVPKLADYAVVDVSQPVTAHAPGGIVAAGFFGEKWELLPNDGKN